MVTTMHAMSHDFLTDSQARGLVHQTNSTELAAHLSGGRRSAYIGFDPTADSLHVGSLMQLMTLRRWQRAGHRPIALVGGATGMIGDPSGKSAERGMLSLEDLAKNVAGIRGQIERFIDFGPGAGLLLNNMDWLGSVKLVDFLRDIGKHFSVNQMITRDSVRIRLETRDHGISYTEFSYMLLQSYDYLQLFDDHGCTVQMGGSDQWGNIVSGADLVRRLRGADAFALTSPLIAKSDGSKFGKTESGNVWLDPARTSAYEFYQFWLNADDRDVRLYLCAFTLLPVAEIDELVRASAAQAGKREAQRVLAREVTRLVHGESALADAEQATQALFDKDADLRAMSAAQLEDAFRGAPVSVLAASALGTPAAGLVAVLADARVYDSRGAARRELTAGGVSVNNVTVKDAAYILSQADLLAGEFIILRKGKKHYHVVKVSA